LAAARAIPVTVALIAVNVVMLLLEEAWGGSGNSQTLVRMGAIYSPRLHGEGAWFDFGSLVASAYLHFGLVHLAMNMFALYSIGRSLEGLLGSSRFFVLYALAGLGGGVAVALSPTPTVTAGASGAVFGLFGAICVLYALRYRASNREHERVAIRNNLAALLLPNVLISLLPGISLLGHLGGFVVGLATMASIHAIYQRPIDRVAANRRFTVAAIFLAALTVSGIGAVWSHLTPWV
jgi:rhomboid protease GluP